MSTEKLNAIAAENTGFSEYDKKVHRRSDEDKQFLLSVIDNCPDPQWAEDNFRACIAKANRPEIYEAFENSGFSVFKRDFSAGDTRQEMLTRLARHFGLE